MRSTAARVVCAAAISAFAIGATPSVAQTSVTSVDDLRRELAAGDFVTVTPSVGPPVAGRLVRFGDVDLEVRPAARRTRQQRLRAVSIPLSAIVSVERPRDSVRNGAAIGAGVGAGVGGALFVSALAIDRNEVDEWAPIYAGVAAICTGIGALIGWAIDAANSKPHLRFDAGSARRLSVRVQPAYSRRGGLALALSVSR